ncbi:poly [ADP-ribose] polymerase 14 [Lingula anatina]|uniref:Poly [ADP-ribose] polymerase n=1 Tax=Lingula anatina TaxID=7574 RepID=A0A1S3J0Y7_LINAN|nr:poly [ADP-ribose] polymerase 14 [Lingula anatina]|eukprot:XP_013403474.1 poly [ADP-ribose] polymerase 14 [Lingula anatina]
MAELILREKAIIVKTYQPQELDQLIIYFQSHHQSDGGDVNEQQSRVSECDSGTAIICFEEKETARRVLAKQDHHFVGVSGIPCQLTVEPYAGSKYSPAGEGLKSNKEQIMPGAPDAREGATASPSQQLPDPETADTQAENASTVADNKTSSLKETLDKPEMQPPSQPDEMFQLHQPPIQVPGQPRYHDIDSANSYAAQQSPEHKNTSERSVTAEATGMQTNRISGHVPTEQPPLPTGSTSETLKTTNDSPVNVAYQGASYPPPTSSAYIPYGYGAVPPYPAQPFYPYHQIMPGAPDAREGATASPSQQLPDPETADTQAENASTVADNKPSSPKETLDKPEMQPPSQEGEMFQHQQPPIQVPGQPQYRNTDSAKSHAAQQSPEHKNISERSITAEAIDMQTNRSYGHTSTEQPPLPTGSTSATLKATSDSPGNVVNQGASYPPPTSSAYVPYGYGAVHPESTGKTSNHNEVYGGYPPQQFYPYHQPMPGVPPGYPYISGVWYQIPQHNDVQSQQSIPPGPQYGQHMLQDHQNAAHMYSHMQHSGQGFSPYMVQPTGNHPGKQNNPHMVQQQQNIGFRNSQHPSQEAQHFGFHGAGHSPRQPQHPTDPGFIYSRHYTQQQQNSGSPENKSFTQKPPHFDSKAMPEQQLNKDVHDSQHSSQEAQHFGFYGVGHSPRQPQHPVYPGSIYTQQQQNSRSSENHSFTQKPRHFDPRAMPEQLQDVRTPNAPIVSPKQEHTLRTPTQGLFASENSAVEEPTMTSVEQSSEAATSQQLGVLVQGIGTDISKDHLEMYFESEKRSDGGPIEDLDYTPGTGKAIIHFKDASVADRLVKRGTVTMKDSTLTISWLPELSNACTVIVTGIQHHTTEDALRLYFENEKRSGAQGYKDLQYSGGSGHALVTFESSEGAANFVKAGTGKSPLDGATLQISWPTTEDTVATNQTWNGRVTVLVSGIKTTTKEETLKMYFESRRRSGGGPVKKLVYKEGSGQAEITFEEAEDATSVLEKSKEMTLVLEGEKLKAVSSCPLPLNPKLLLFSNLVQYKPNLKSTLMLYLENISGIDGKDITLMYGESPRVLLVKFSTDIDFASFKEKCMERRGKGRDGSLGEFNIEPVSYPTAVQAHGLKGTTTESIIQLHFEKLGCSCRVNMVSKNRTRVAMITFDDYKVVDKICEASPYTIEEKRVVVIPFYPCLGVTNPQNTDVPYLAIPPPEDFYVDPLLIEFLQAAPQHHRKLKDMLQKYFGDVSDVVKQEAGTTSLIVECTISPNMANAFSEMEVWSAKISEAMKQFLQNYDQQEIKVPSNIGSVIWERVDEMVQSYPGRLLFHKDEKNMCIQVVGEKGDVSGVLQRMSETIHSVQEDAHSVSSQVKMKDYAVYFLENGPFLQQLGESCPLLQIEPDFSNKVVNLKGHPVKVDEAKIQLFQYMQEIKTERIAVTNAVLDFLRKESCCQFLQEEFGKRSLNVHVMCGSNEANIYALSSQESGQCEIQKAIELIQQKIKEKKISVQEGGSAVIRERKWQDMKDQLSRDYEDLIDIQVSPQKKHLTIVALADTINKIENHVQSFLRCHSVVEHFEEVAYPKAIYIQKFKMEEVNKVERDLRFSAVDISLKVSETGKCGFSIKGNPDGVEKATKTAVAIIETIKKETYKIDQPVVAQFYSDERGQILLKNTAGSNNCIVEKSGRRGPGHAGKCVPQEFNHPSGIVFKVCQGDLTKYHTDAVVNTANERLASGGGLDGAIKKAGGAAIQRECDDIMNKRRTSLDAGEVEVTGPGKLPCKHIFHAVGPRWRGGRSGEREALQRAVENILKKCSEERVESVAIPAISAGIFGYPKEKATETMVKAASDLCSRSKPDGLKEIHFVDRGEDIIDLFASAVAKNLKDSAAAGGNISEDEEDGYSVNDFEVINSGGGDTDADTDEEIEKDMQQSDGDFIPLGGKEDMIMTKERIKVTLKKGQLAEEQVDVIVNTTQTNLDLSKGALSRALLEKAGEELQSELSRKRQIKHGEIICTQGYKLPCLEVYHCACVKWDEGKGDSEKVLRTIVRGCLENAHKSGDHSSIAFPSVGTGGLGFPAELVAGALFDEVKEFGIRNPNTKIKDVRLVVFERDVQTVHDFEAEMQRLKDGGKTREPNVSKSYFFGWFSKSPSRKDEEGDSSKPASIFSNFSQNSRGYCQMKVGKIKVQVQQGDLTKEDVDVVVNSTNDKLNLDAGGVSKAIKRAGGKEVEDACKKAGQTTDGFAVTTAGRMKCKSIIHMDGRHFHQNWRKAVCGCLALAENKKFKTVAMPAFGTGAMHHSPQAIADSMLDGIADFFSRHKPRFVELVRITLHQVELLEVFQDSMKTKLSGNSRRQEQSEKGGSKFQRKRTMALSLDIYYTRRDDLNNFKDEIKKLAEKEILTKSIENDNIGKLSGDQMKKITDVAKDAAVEVIDERSRSKVMKLRGRPSDVLKVQDVVQKMLDEIAKKQNQKVINAAKLKDIQWTFFYKDKEYSYDPFRNAEIEEAYKKKRQEYEYSEKGRKFKLDFSNMQVCCQGGKSEVVTRKDLKASGNFALPRHWSPMPKDTSVILVPLNSSSAEYQEVEKKFKATGSGVSPQKIERIQNPKLYLPYIAKREEMKKRLPGKVIEHICYHGTDTNSTKFINHNGFNRSYCGKNGTALGAGVYFATDSQTSIGYARGGTGGRIMYQARVLTGDYTGGSSSMQVAPKKPDNVTDYDSVVNNTGSPSVFVIFHDSQAYPEYQITF